jgi:hypothetical protein
MILLSGRVLGMWSVAGFSCLSPYAARVVKSAKAGCRDADDPVLPISFRPQGGK